MAPIEPTEALRYLDFGKVDAESEPDLDERFVRTRDFDEFVTSDTWVVLGAKGTGKSALFDLLARFENLARTLASDELSDVILTSGTGFSDLSEIATGDLEALRSESGYDHEKLWRLYMAVRAGLALTDLSWSLPNGPLKDLLRAVGSRRDLRVGPLLRQLWVLTLGNPPSQVSIASHGATITISGGRRQLDVITLLQDINAALEREDKAMWLLFDKVDELYPQDRTERTKALSALMSVSMAIRRTFPRIQPRIMLRTDIWRGLDFTNKSHFSDKQIELMWTRQELELLLTKRACAVPIVRNYVEQSIPAFNGRPVESVESGDRLRALELIFPETVYPGDREAAIMDWIAARVTDGMGTVLPREAILLGNTAATEQWYTGSASTPSLISRDAVKEAFRKVSEIRCSTYLAEFPHLSEHVSRFEGQITPVFRRQALLELIRGCDPDGIDGLRELYEIGLIRPLGGAVATALRFEIPRLYRQGLGMVIRGRP